MAEPGESRECIIEIVRLGDLLKVSAIDPQSGVEVSVSGPAGAGTQALSRLAERKLAYRLARSRN